VNEASIRRSVRQKLEEGTLPREDPARTWAGPGLGQRCVVCEEPIARTETEYELQFGIDLRSLRFHRLCQAAWDAERSRVR
jgi:hypothetical protein